MVERVKTGIPGLDELMDGGIPKGNVVLLSGQAGSGKTILGLQFLVNGAIKYKERGLYITFEEKRKNIILQASLFGWKIEDLESQGLLKLYSFFPIKRHLYQVNTEIDSVIHDFKPQRIVFDSISTYSVFAEILTSIETASDLGIEENVLNISPQTISRKAIMDLVAKLKESEATCLLISERSESKKYLSRDTISEFLADGIILLYYTEIGGENFGHIQIRKMRNTHHEHSLYFTKFTENGIEIGEQTDISFK
ncbi:MAG: RAD55 family ATPase [Candidatus Freyarchaeota archaeon]